MAENKPRVVWTAISWAGVGAAVVIAGFFGMGTWQSMQGEYTLHATHIVLNAYLSFVRKHKRFPKSWEELSETPAKGGVFQWPEDSPKIQERVAIDFEIEISAIIDGLSKVEDVIQPIQPTYLGSLEPRFDQLRMEIFEMKRNRGVDRGENASKLEASSR